MEAGDIRICGKIYDPNTMTARELRESRRILREELFADEEIPDVLAQADTMPPMMVVLRRRDDPSFTLDQALDIPLQPAIVTAEDVEREKAGGPPTPAAKPKRAAASKTSETSGPVK